MKGQRTLKSISVFFVFCLGLASAIASGAASGNDGGGDRIGDTAGALRGTPTGTVEVPEKQVCSTWAGVNINLTQEKTEALFSVARTQPSLLCKFPNRRFTWMKTGRNRPPCKQLCQVPKEQQKEQIKEALEQIKAFVTKVKEALAAVIDKIRKAIQYIKEQIKKAVQELLKVKEVQEFLEKVYEAIKENQELIQQAIADLVAKIKEKLEPIKQAIARVVEKIKLQVTKIVEQITNKTGKTCKVTIVAEPEPLAEDPGSEKTCSDSKHPVYIKLGTGEREAVFKCGDGLTTLEPTQDAHHPKFCKSADCKETTELAQAFQKPYWDDRNKHANIYRLVIPTEERKDTRMYYKCKGASGSADPCTVLISVKSTETDHDKEEDVQECTVGTEKKVTLSPTDTVKFKCNLGTVVQPSFSTATPKVFDDSDGSCSAPASLTSLVDASLTEDSSHDRYTKYTMNLNARPAETKNLCLQCSSGKQNCKMRIHVPSTDSTSSGPGSLSGFLSSVVGLVVCAGFFLVY
uniref:SAG-related sequence SRS59B n=1 Tax=Toxoplasma gondii (strain ATCC 50861 / VEG) TaxID=432359 RepID=A0A0F7VBQ2_TOXGV|nr:TPA: hypothetical protein BN1205_000373 [Toxoplasma gondii VEG]